MPLTTGTRLGPYEIVAPLGSGGMGEVYKARDTRLKRDVAIKGLPDAFAQDPDRLARFQREAELLATLNHPNIAAVYGLEKTEGLTGIVLELVEGPTLAEVIARSATESAQLPQVSGPSVSEARQAVGVGPHGIPMNDALTIARQIADALEAAHEKGVIHRDLKPANVALTAEGQVKVLDFGLAKALDADPLADVSNSPTLSLAATRAGVILGTAAYMSPEQAKGRGADKRSDVWAFGCVLYEMLTGKRAFEGEDVSDTLAAVLRGEPDWTALPPDVPPAIRSLLKRCLEKNPGRRVADLSTALFVFDEAASLASGATATAAPVVRIAAPVWRRALPWTVAGAFALALVGTLVTWAPWRKAAPPAPLRLSAELGADASLVTDQGAAAVLSPDGDVLALVAQKSAGGNSQLYVRRLEQLQAAPLSGTDGARNPFFSPDGQWIAFFAGGKLKKISVTGGGGAAVTLCNAPNGRGGTWAEDGTIMFSPSNVAGVSLMRVSSAGGKPEPLTTLDQGEVTQRWPQVLPGGKAVLYAAASGTTAWEDANLVVQPLPTGARKLVQRGGYYGQYLRSGHLATSTTERSSPRPSISTGWS